MLAENEYIHKSSHPGVEEQGLLKFAYRNRFIILVLFLTLIMAIPFSASAQDESAYAGAPDGSVDGEPGYCRWIKGVSDSERAILMYPEIYSTLGPTASGSKESADENSISNQLALRLTVGLQYRFIGLYQGILEGSYADARCLRYLAQNQLQIALEVGRDWGRRAALEAKEKVIKEALPAAEERLVKLYEQLKNNIVTVNELYSVQLKVDNLRDMLNQTQFELERVKKLPEAPSDSLDDILRRFNDIDDRIEAYEGRLRRSKAWALDIKGGYDQSFGNEKDYPLFAQILLSFNFGGIAQPGADKRSAAGRRAWRGESVETLQSSVETLKYELANLARAERKRLVEISALADDLSERLKILDALHTENSQRFRNSMWLDYVRLDAERTYLEKHLTGLQKMEKEDPQAVE